MNDINPTQIKPVEKPRQFNQPQLSSSLVEVDRLVRASEARNTFQVSGNGLTVAVADTGLNATHVDFTGKVSAQRNFTNDNGSDENNADDGNGHGTNVGGIITARRGDHGGIAPDANIIPLKVLQNSGSGNFGSVVDALQWAIDNRLEHDISVVCMSLGDSGNYQSDAAFSAHDIRQRIDQLRSDNVAVCIAAGNDFFVHNSEQGMGFPGILSGCVSVGAVYDEFEGPFSYGSGAATTASGPDRITPFSQRLHETVSTECRTDIFAPGAPVRSSGINGPNGESVQHGTSQATPVTAGVILLMQEFHLRETGSLPSVDKLVDWMRRSGASINDGDDEKDNVTNTGLNFSRVTAVGALDAIRRDLELQLFLTGTPLKN